MKKIAVLRKEYRETTVMEGSAILFFLCFWATKVYSFLRGRSQVLKRLVDGTVRYLPALRFVIQNKAGIFAIQTFDDSLTICSDYFEKDLKPWVRQAAQKDIFVDVGANRGVYTIYAHRCGFRSVCAFEPNPEVYQTLKANIGLNAITAGTRTYQMAVGRTETVLPFTADVMHKGGGHIIAEGNESQPVCTVPVCPLDKVLADEEKRRVGFVKIDTEGYEREVLAGMTETLQAMPPESRIMIETTALPEVSALLRQYDFDRTETRNCDHLFIKTC